MTTFNRAISRQHQYIIRI